MSHSTHVGFNAPPTAVGRSSPFFRRARSFARPSAVRMFLSASHLRGVGQRLCFAIAPSVGRLAAPALFDLLKYDPESTDVGVGNIFTCADNFGSPRSLRANSRFAESSAVGVRHNEDAFPSMRSANVGSTVSSPSNDIPQVGKVSHHIFKGHPHSAHIPSLAVSTGKRDGVFCREQATHVFQ